MQWFGNDPGDDLSAEDDAEGALYLVKEFLDNVQDDNTAARSEITEWKRRLQGRALGKSAVSTSESAVKVSVALGRTGILGLLVYSSIMPLSSSRSGARS